MESAKPVLLEPVYSVEVIVPEKGMGDIIGDFNSKRGRILGMEPTGDGLGCVRALVPDELCYRFTFNDTRSWQF